MPVKLDDTKHGDWLGRPDENSRAVFRQEMHRTVRQLASVPSIAVWVLFNEGWGQFDARTVADELHRLDGTRPVDHASGWHDQGGGDLRSVHVYVRRFRVPKGRDGRVLVLSEYGGRTLLLEGREYGDEKAFGYGSEQSPAGLTDWFVRLHSEQLSPAVEQGLSASVYTQLSDVEGELNGLLTYDREMLKVSPDAVRSALSQLRLGSTPVTGSD